MRSFAVNALGGHVSPYVTGLIAVGFIVIMIVAIVLTVIISVKNSRSLRTDNGNHRFSSRIGMLRHNLFDGSYRVDVSPAQWGMGAPVIRDVAAARGYIEIAPRGPYVISFVLSSASTAPSANVTPQATTSTYNGMRADPLSPSRRESSLLRKVCAEGQRWISLRDLGCSPGRLESLLAAYGMRIVFACADSEDQLLLVHCPTSAGTDSAAAAKSPRPTVVLIILMYGLCGALLTAAMVCFSADLNVFGLIIAQLVVAASFVRFVLRVFSRSTRAAMLAKEFKGKTRSIYLGWYGFSGYLVSEVARSYGYIYITKDYSKMGGTYINYARARE